LQQEALEGPIRLQAAEVLRHESVNPAGAPRWEGAETFEDLFDREVISHRGWTEVWNGSQGWGVERRQRTLDVGGQRMLFLRQNAGSLTQGPIPDSAEGCPAGAIRQAPCRGFRGAVAPPRGRLSGQVFLNKGSLLACGPAGQASSDNSYGLLAMTAAAAPHGLEDNPTEGRQAPDGRCSGIRCDAFQLESQL
jgi:hypothetical protein